MPARTATPTSAGASTLISPRTVLTLIAVSPSGITAWVRSSLTSPMKVSYLDGPRIMGPAISMSPRPLLYTATEPAAPHAGAVPGPAGGGGAAVNAAEAPVPGAAADGGPQGGAAGGGGAAAGIGATGGVGAAGFPATALAIAQSPTPIRAIATSHGNVAPSP